MSKQYSTHHSFDIELAAKYGVHEAIIIHHFQHWINHNKKTGKNFKNGKTWSYQSRSNIAAWFPYLTERQVKHIINKLISLEVLEKGNFNKFSMDKTNWYAFKNEEMFTTDINVQSTDINVQSADKNVQAIPDTKTDTKTDNKKEKKEKEKVATAPPRAQIISFGSDEKVKLTKEEYQKLREQIDERSLNVLIESLNNYIGSTGKKYKSHYATIKSWHAREQQKQSSSKTEKQKRNERYFENNPEKEDLF